MNFNKSLISLIAIILFQTSMSYTMEVKAILDQKTLHQLNLLFLLNQKKCKQQSDRESWAKLMEPFIIPSIEKMLDLDMSDKETKLNIVEVLIQQGQLDLTALEKILTSSSPQIQIIKLFLGYGATITEEAIELAKSKVNSQELLNLFDLHTRLLKQVENNPTKELLRVAITFNKPYVVQLIAKNKPKLVTLEHLKLAQEKCPAALPHLYKVFKLVGLKKFAEKEISNAINQRI